MTVPGNPVPNERARKGRGHWYTPATTADYRERVLAAWMVEGRPQLGAGPLHADLQFVYALPSSYLRKDGGPRKGAPAYPHPDVDNLVKGVLDALNGYAYQDDRQVVRLSCGKRWARPGEEPHTQVALATAT